MVCCKGCSCSSTAQPQPKQPWCSMPVRPVHAWRLLRPYAPKVAFVLVDCRADCIVEVAPRTAHLWKSKCTSVESSDSCSSTWASCPACSAPRRPSTHASYSDASKSAPVQEQHVPRPTPAHLGAVGQQQHSNSTWMMMKGSCSGVGPPQAATAACTASTGASRLRAMRLCSARCCDSSSCVPEAEPQLCSCMSPRDVFLRRAGACDGDTSD